MIGEKSLLKNYVAYLKNDVNYSFIMFKPDAKGNPEIFDLVNKEMKKQSIELFFVYNCILDEEQVITLWENSCCSDFVLQRIVVEYLKNVEVIFWIVGSVKYNVPIDVDINFDPYPILWTLENAPIPIRGHQTVPLLKQIPYCGHTPCPSG